MSNGSFRRSIARALSGALVRVALAGAAGLVGCGPAGNTGGPDGGGVGGSIGPSAGGAGAGGGAGGAPGGPSGAGPPAGGTPGNPVAEPPMGLDPNNQVNPGPLPGDQHFVFSAVLARGEMLRPIMAARQTSLLEQRYDLSDRPSSVTMTRGKPLQTGVRVRLAPGLTWEDLAA